MSGDSDSPVISSDEDGSIVEDVEEGLSVGTSSQASFNGYLGEPLLRDHPERGMAPIQQEREERANRAGHTRW